MRYKVIAFLLLILTAVDLAEAQQAKVSRIGYLGATTPGSAPAEAFRQGLRDLGYVEGKNIIIEYRYAEGVNERFANLAAELVSLKVDVILTGGTPATQAAKNATQTVPIVMVNTVDPVGTGLVASLARPGGNITGLTNVSGEFAGKLLELLKEAFPKVSRVAVLWDPANAGNALSLGEIKVAARALQITLQSAEVHGPDDFEPAFSAIKKERAGGLIVLRNVIASAYLARIVDSTAKSRLPTMYTQSDYVDAGGLMSYGPNLANLYRRAAVYVDKILKGTKPAELPVEQPTKFEFIINLKAAKQIGLTIPPTVLARADKVIK
ncbi:MAG: ABC transporter substrate-binding protein [Verrucomicrobia bacterium]|nr:MAG: ABC transporter substrate-binding protein [Verrucomicrobiota bacterium]